MLNNERYDLSNRLIHFFRELNLDDESSPDIPEEWGMSNIAEDTVFSSMFLLRSAIRHGHLWATWSIRSKRRSIYGPRPAICYTEMPTAAFIETARIRKDAGQKISSHALTFQKIEMFSLGASPVIYGLSDRSASIPTTGTGSRIIDRSLLPEGEQYRYVTYNPVGRQIVDWTHEREWRWPFPDDITAYEKLIEEMGIASEVKDIPGLNLYASELSAMGVIVNTHEESKMVLHDILSLVDRDIISPTKYSYILPTESIGTVSDLRDPKQERLAIKAAMIDLAPFLTPDPSKDKRIADRIREMIGEIEREANAPEEGEFGGCWLWIVDNFHEVTRALLNEKRIAINQDHKYLVTLVEYDGSRSLGQREEMTKTLAKRVSTEFGVSAGYFSVLGSDDYNAVPFYNDDHLDNHVHYNWYHYGLD
jgi:hypothetical protein